MEKTYCHPVGFTEGVSYVFCFSHTGHHKHVQTTNKSQPFLYFKGLMQYSSWK